jgi:hypothetical protein
VCCSQIKWHSPDCGRLGALQSAQWKAPIRLTLIWDSTSDQYVGLVSIGLFEVEKTIRLLLNDFDLILDLNYL